MSSPRIFISSTCYDLQEIRLQLRLFIENFGYEPVMSEFGDIFYDYAIHVQDACLKEVEKSNIFVLIIGNNYGSAYHKSLGTEEHSSITHNEFKKALQTKIPKHIFINKFVEHDYKNYRKALETKLKETFSKQKPKPEEIEKLKFETQKNFDLNYHFPENQYKSLFKFIELIYEQKTNNAVFTFDNVEEIKNSLKRQWSGFIFQHLTEYQLHNKKNEEVESLQQISNKLSNLEEIIKELVSGKKETENSLSIDITNLKATISGITFDNARDLLDSSINHILEEIDYYNEPSKRIIFTKTLLKSEILNWLNSLEEIITNYKWSKFVSVTTLFKALNYRYYQSYENVPIQHIVDLWSLYKDLNESEKESFANTILSKFEKFVDLSHEDYSSDYPGDDDIPF